MFEFIEINGNDYYIASPTNIGIIKISQKDVVLIDSGLDKIVAKRILNILNEKNLNLISILNTHSHADHIGGNKYLQDNTNCSIYCSKGEYASIVCPIYEPIMLYGGYPLTEFNNHFF